MFFGNIKLDAKKKQSPTNYCILFISFISNEQDRSHVYTCNSTQKSHNPPPPPKKKNLCPFLSTTKQLQGSNSIVSYSKSGPRRSICSASQLQSVTCKYDINFQTLRDCKFGISRYPDFTYNAEGGKGTAVGITKDTSFSREITVSFDVDTLYIPPLTSGTTRFLGLPLPPFLKIDIVPEFLSGVVNRDSGKVELDFRAKFWFSVGSIYRAEPLLVGTKLTSEESKGSIRGGKGERLDEDGRRRLVGVAVVDPIDDLLMDSFLGLPTECLAVLNATLRISDAS